MAQEAQDLKAQLAKHGDTLGFVEKVSLDLLSKFKILFPTTFAPHHKAAETPIPEDVVTSAVGAQPAVS